MAIILSAALAMPAWAQSPHRGYNANGGWHQRTVSPAPAPVRRTQPRKPKAPKTKLAPAMQVAPPPASPQKS